MLDHWPSGIRDTTQFPELSIEITPEYRKHLEAFLKLEKIGWSDYESQENIAHLGIKDQRYRTYRKLYQNYGLIYKDGDQIALSRLGQFFSELPNSIEKEKEKRLKEACEIAIDILSRYQLYNPTEDQLSELPVDCDVLPSICIWRIMLECDFKLHYEEMNRVVLRIMKMDELDSAINKIKDTRNKINSDYSANNNNLDFLLGKPVHSEQVSARIAPWFSFVGWGGLIIGQQANKSGFRELISINIDLLKNKINKPYSFLKTEDISEWTNYYLGNFKSYNKNTRELSFISNNFLKDIESAGFKGQPELPIRLISSLCTKRFIIFTGLSGSGKTKLAQIFAKWISEPAQIKSTQKTFDLNEVIEADRAKYKITSLDSLSVTLTQLETGTKVNLPYELIYEWINVIVDKKFSTEISPREIRQVVGEITKYSPQLNSFESHLKASAFHLIKKETKSPNFKNTQICIVPVGADWTNREPLLGYPNALEKGKYVKPENGVLQIILEAGKPENQNKPYFLILDEMNLSHVERYFADFLSAMESGEDIPLHAEMEDWQDDVPEKIKLPPNLFIIGTVNIDETTYMFSPKVLDRANVIEFRVTKDEMKDFLSNTKHLDINGIVGQGKNLADSFVLLAKNSEIKLDNVADLKIINDTLNEFFVELKKTGAEFGYRSATEIHRFTAIVKHLETNRDINKIIDWAIMQKLLPKVHGSKRKLESVLKTLGSLCLQNDQKFDEFLTSKNEIDFEGNPKIKYPVSLEKILRMYNNMLSNGFTSYAEA